ncbi:MAG: hypothetical protein QOG22_2086 [Pseudonocardiales bacterium]|jgi:uncharacterized protein (DUF1501 family)|nr:hypothetical protein [Pseudonocardiales bacterium]
MTTIEPPMAAELALRRRAEQVSADLCAQDDAWGTSGWTRRKFLTATGLVGVAALGSQLVTTRSAYAATASTTQNTLVTIFLRGAADGLRILAPNSSLLGLDFLRTVRGPLVPGDAQLLPLAGTTGWAVHHAMQPLVDGLWSSGELAFVPAVSAGGVNRSHFDAQQLLEKGGLTSYSTGWLDRVLQQLGPGTTFRATGEGYGAPASFAGDQPKLVIDSLADFKFPGWDDIRPASEQAVSALYRGMTGTLGEDVPTTVSALATAATVRAGAGVQNAAVYPAGNFSGALKDLADVLRAEVGLQVATVDVGGWDTHTNEVHDLDALLTAAAQSLAAFMTDLGPTRRSRVTVVVMTEFGRRVAMNDSGGADHGHGSLIWLLGGGIVGGQVHGNWTPLSAATLADGDVPGVNNMFDVLGEVVQKRLGVGALSSVFPNHVVNPIGVATPG